ncbi:RagB/SusD family nutrient uptake outer membrane protein [uncultured Bacteroides sp.]|uniref:RagB/SusD family nutrient uptake outer membrane protein n=1 Tax=uncultured Bacteroides sp. TaxID=162156 RepID=UPI0025D09A14|nr:RagB/SusD family nutrient uptake outer membrane protein [uncultured Bacteroides sp.]
MKKTLKYILSFLFAAVLLNSCNYLDIVPDEVATEKDVFVNSKAAEKYLYSCYGYLPQSNYVDNCLDFAGDETISPFNQCAYVKFAEGNYDANNTVISYWNTLFQGIRQCYLLKDNIHTVPGLEPAVMEDYIAQADFLIAYFHMLLIKCYGPTVLVKETPKFDTPRENYLSRSPYDECVAWVANLFDEVAKRLPETRTGNEYGLATSTAAKAFKGRLLLYAASPLFNGNSDYSEFKNQEGTPLINQTYDPNKWKLAADAALEAIQLAEKNYKLYEMLPGSYANFPEPQNPTVRTLRFSYMDKENCHEVIFAETRKAGGIGIQRKSIPWLKGGGWNGIAPTITMIDRFYTKNGLPIEEDPEFDYTNRLDIVTIPEDMEFAEAGKQTLRMHLDREPRFYAWIAFQNGYYECRTEREKDAYAASFNAKRSNGNKWLTGFLKNENCGLFDNRTNNYSKTGYLNKKSVHPGHAAAESTKPNNYEYPWPVIRLSELYLNYAEACVGYDKEGYPAKGMHYLDLVRRHAGIPDVKDSWAKAKHHPLLDYSDGKGGLNGPLTDIVRQERMVELYMENHNFWDIRRWKLGEVYFNVPMRGLNIQATNLQDFAQIVELQDQRRFDAPRQYLLPIPSSEITKNPNMIQNPGY